MVQWEEVFMILFHIEDVVRDCRPVIMGRDGGKEVEGAQVLAFKHSAPRSL